MPMNILIADSDKDFISDIRRSWALDDTELSLCNDKDKLMPLVKNSSIDLAFIEVPSNNDSVETGILYAPLPTLLSPVRIPFSDIS